MKSSEFQHNSAIPTPIKKMNINFGQSKNASLDNIIKQLEAKWVVLEAEAIQVAKDLKTAQQMQTVYGSHCDELVKYLRELKHQKLKEMRKIQDVMIKFDFDPQKCVRVLAQLQQDQ